MAAGTVAVLLLGARWSEPPRPATPSARPHETPWLSNEAAAQIIGPGGTLGPLFAGASLGEPVPAEVRARIAAFARANHVAIDLEVRDGELAAIRFEVSYSGCCGYEGADVLALRLDRPHTGGCTWPDTWIDDWALVTDDGVYVRARSRVNRLVVRWERAWSVSEVVERADQLLGQSVAAVRGRAGDRWFDLPVGALVEVPFAFELYAEHGGAVWMNHDERGIHVLVEHARIAEVSFALADRDASAAPLRDAVRARWGRPRTKRGDTWRWRTPDRSITADMASYRPTLTIRAIGATSATPSPL